MLDYPDDIYRGEPWFSVFHDHIFCMHGAFWTGYVTQGHFFFRQNGFIMKARMVVFGDVCAVS